MRKYTILIVALLALTGCRKSDDGDSGGKIKVGDSVPQFTITSTDGTATFNTLSMQSDVLIYFYWYKCSGCIEQSKILKEAKELWSDPAKLQFVAIDRAASTDVMADLEAYWAATELGTPLFYDSDRSVFDLFASINVPRLYLVDKSGKVRWHSRSGEVTSAKDIINAVAAL